MIHKFSRYLLTLVALLAMTTGAWADKGTLLTTINASSDFTNGSKTFDNVAKVTLSGQVVYESNAWMAQYGDINNGTITLEAVNGVTVTSYKLYFDYTAPYTINASSATLYFYCEYSSRKVCSSTNYNSSEIGSEGITKIEVYGTTAPEVEVEISTDQTSAEFDMPSYDATLEYDIVRNLASNTTLNLFIGEEAVTADARLRIKKDGSAYIPVSALSFTLTDAPEGGQTTTLTAAQALAAKLNPVYELKGEGDQWTVAAINETTHLPATLAPGQTYRVSLVAADDAPLYGGEVQAQYLVTLFEGYEVTVPAGEYVTYYKDENLYVEDEDAKLYTITAVGEQTATVAELTVAPALTPILVQNTAQTPQTILLIPTTDKTPDAVEAYTGFIGTLEATQIAASDASANRYAFNGKQFVWVKTAIAVGANKAWLEIPTGANARVINLVFDNTTGISNTNLPNLTNGDWYDLNGRKLDRKPTMKGIFIKNGQKVVIK